MGIEEKQGGPGQTPQVGAAWEPSNPFDPNDSAPDRTGGPETITKLDGEGWRRMIRRRLAIWRR